jgi:sugar O-acyltransferase (sialic acid O-acetyltransferase NeuD family)
MIIVGASGFAKEVCEVLLQNKYNNPIAFFDDINTDAPNYLYNKYPVLKSMNEAKVFMQQNGNAFTLGVGTPRVRYKLANRFINVGGQIQTIVSPHATIGRLNSRIDKGCSIMSGVIITSEVTIEEGVLINLSCTIGHNSQIKQYAELSPMTNVSGGVTVGEFSFLGTGSIVLPNIEIGNNSIIAAGSVVTKNVPDNVMVAGVPCVIKKYLETSQ